MKLLVKITSECVRTYNRSTKGYEVFSEVQDLKDMYNQVAALECNDWFEQPNGMVWDASGNEVYDPAYPEIIEYGDYMYVMMDTDDLDDYNDAHKITAMKLAGY